MAYAIEHRQSKQRDATARWRARSAPVWIRHKSYDVGGVSVRMAERSRRGEGVYGTGPVPVGRVQAMMLLGGQCERCGMDDLRCLQVDHVNADGSLDKLNDVDRPKGVARVWVGGLQERYQVLCANCNWIKRADNNEARIRPNLKEGMGYE